MRKKLATLLTVVTLAATVLSGCGGSGGTAETASGENSSETSEASAEGDIVEIFWQFPSANEVTEAFYRMEDALNEMMEKDIGVHVTFIPTGLMNSQQDATLMVSSGEQLDIMLTAFTSVGNLVDSGLILPLDDYLEEYGQGIVETCGSKVGGCYYDGKLYSLPTCADQVFNTYGYIMKKEYADKYGFEADDNKLYTMEQMEEMFAIVKEGEGDNFYMTVPWNNTYEPLNYSYQEYDPVTGSFSGGVLMLNRSFEDLTLYDYFETEEYKAYCEMMYDWAQKGYIAPDAAVDTDYSNRAADSNYLGSFAYAAPESGMLTTPASWGQDVVQFRTVDGFFKLNGGCTVNWNVPVTSGNPAKAVQAIGYVLTHPEVATLIQYGFEGEEYEVVEEVDGVQVIKYLAEDATQLPYNNVYGLWGDRFRMAQVYPGSAEFGSKMIAYQNAIPDSRKSPALGYSFKQEAVSAEIAAVETVMEQYCFSFNAGALDPDKALPEFIAALKAAGIDDIIAENQRQLDEWAANK